jgi:hypothetical protein
MYPFSCIFFDQVVLPNKTPCFETLTAINAMTEFHNECEMTRNKRLLNTKTNQEERREGGIPIEAKSSVF